MKKMFAILICLALLVALPAMAQQDIGAQEAQRIALEHAGVAADAALVVKSEKEMEDGRWVYDVEFVADNKEYDYEIDAATGEVIAFDGDAESYQPQPGEITIAQALDIALKKAGLTRDQVRVTKSKLEMDNGRRVYEIEFVSGNSEYESEIDPATGAVLDWDRDN